MKIDTRLIFIEGTHVLLKVLEENDILESDWAGWFNNEQLCQYNQHHYYPNTIETQKVFLKNLEQNKEKIQLGIVRRDHPEKICGVVSLNSINYINRNCEMSVILSNYDTKEKLEIILETWKLIFEHAFKQLGMEKIYAGTFHPHIALTLKRIFNFEQEGILKRHVFKNGEYQDIEQLSVFRDTIIYPEL